jgi:tetratricopeptide (TPR) repeat protein
MKSEHRHELKTNELADWLANFPQWAKENRIMIIAVAIVIVAAGTFYIWRFYNRRAMIQKQIELTSLVSQFLNIKMQALRAQAEGKDLSYTLLQPAGNLKNFAQSIKNDQMTAFALVKQAEALRTELHCRSGTINKQNLTTQIKEAMASYNEAVEKASFNPSLMAAAKFGLGLCEEELGNFEAAQKMYQDIAANPDFEGTVAKASAKKRLQTMAVYKTMVVFMAPAKPKPPTATKPSIQTESKELDWREPGSAKPQIKSGVDVNQAPTE